VSEVQQSGEGLQKTLKQRHINMIAIGGVIGAGLFVGSGAVINAAGPGAIFCYLLTGLLVVFTMRMLGEMSVASPSTGSFAVYAGEALGHWAGYTIGWLYWYAWVMLVAFEATAGAGIIHGIWPAIPNWVTCIVLTTLLAYVNSISVKSYGEFEYWFAMIKVAAIVLFLIIGFAVIFNLYPAMKSPGFSNFIDRGGLFPNGLGAIGSGCLMVIFSYFGVEIAAIASNETPDPAKNVKMAINTVIWRILIFYIGSLTVITFLVPWNSTAVLQSPFVTTMQEIGIPGAAAIMTFVVITAVFSCLNSGLYTSSRMLFGIAEKGEAPKMFLKLNKHGVPITALIFSTIVSYIAAAFNYISPEKVFVFLINASGAVALLVFLIIAVSQIILRRRAERNGQELEFKMWCFPYLTYITIACLGAVVIGMFTVPDLRSQVLTTFGFGLAVVASYFLFFKKSQEKDKNAEEYQKVSGN
jgi:GABA permease